ncbi:replication initiator protein [Capybara microvirus Cap1_SP_121]|nr:replication initiator protein [Capybara microvirus Cap1_SP_121]
MKMAEWEGVVENYNNEWSLRVPCGQCHMCRMAYSRSWANRCYLEASTYRPETNWFVTLTYDDIHLPWGDGELPTLKKDEISKFMKALRQDMKKDEIQSEGIRFFGCGEYGGKTARPHYHILLMNCKIPASELKVYKTEKGHVLWNIERLTKVWGKGHVVVAELNWETCAYTARYMLKKHKGLDSDYYEQKGIYQEYTRMSRMPGIGQDWLKENWEETWEMDRVLVKGRPMAAPAAFTRKLEELEPETAARIKLRRELRAKTALKTQQTKKESTLSEWEQLQVKEEYLKKRTATLQRRLEHGTI